MKTSAFSLIELIIAVAILSIVSAGIMTAFTACKTTNDASIERSEVLAALRGKAEELQGAMSLDYVDPDDGETYSGIDGVIRRYSKDSENFDIGDLNAVPGAASVGTIHFYLDETQVPVELGGDSATSVVNADGISVGPRSLDSDATNTDDHSVPDSGIYGCTIAPVELRAAWQSSNGIIVERKYILFCRNM
ncbi:MAG: type IV pilus modification PilV family protein [Planctomycetota bacterium]|jgi:prepilin-type N-terminal cleavage/methylation domain-containing protein